MIRVLEDGRLFVLETAHTTYAMRVAETGQPEHLFYGSSEVAPGPDFPSVRPEEAPGNTILYDEAWPAVSLEELPQEISSCGKGDVREPFIELTAADGSFTADFVYESHEVTDGMSAPAELPSAHGTAEEVQTLRLTLRDRNHGYALELYYHVFYECDVIVRRAVFLNETDAPVRLERLASLQLDLRGSGYHVTSFTGHWTREMERHVTPVTAGTLAVSSVTGASGNRANPFFMVAESSAGETAGSVYAFNLIYSGNHRQSVSVSGLGDTRILSGINPVFFSFLLEPGARFEAPEAMMTYSAQGYGGVSKHMHAFIRKHILPAAYRTADRPVLLNSWEAAYFDINEERLLALAQKGAEAGIELFVMDDGWFGKRDDDHSSLGDWTVNPDKLPGGLRIFSEKVHALGLKFGIWVEPEMVNTDSELYRAHPDWTLAIPGKAHAEGRFQRILDLTNPAVTDYMIEAMTTLFQSAEIEYVKWDMNRIFSDYYSPYLPADRQGEVAHRYILGFYRMLRTLTERFPDILFEGCAAGGGRFDPGVLCYCPQIWGSDNTDALCRMVIQNSYSYGYPQECCTSHVSAVPNHQTGRTMPLSTRFAVAAFGNLGYELDLTAIPEEELAAIREQIIWYKKHRPFLQHGTFRRLTEGPVYQWEIEGTTGEIIKFRFNEEDHEDQYFGVSGGDGSAGSGQNCL